MLAQIRNLSGDSINLHRSEPAGSTAASRSPNATTSNGAPDHLATSQPPQPRRSNPHSAPRRPRTFPFPRFLHLEVFVRRPSQPAAPPFIGPASENLHRSRHVGFRDAARRHWSLQIDVERRNPIPPERLRHREMIPGEPQPLRALYVGPEQGGCHGKTEVAGQRDWLVGDDLRYRELDAHLD